MVKQWKKDRVEELSKNLSKIKSVMIISLKGIPGKQLLHIRHSIKDRAQIIMTKKCIIKRALEKLGMPEMSKAVGDVPAILVSEHDPFYLSVILDKEKVPAYAKPGDISPEKIMVPKGPTPFAPGPILTELGDVGIKVKIQGGKITVVKETVVAEKGDTINENVASILKKLNIMPMEMGLDIKLAFVDKKLFKNVHVDIDGIKNKISLSNGWAFNLAVNAGILTLETVELLISKADSESLNLAVEANILNKRTAEIIFGRAHHVASSLLGV